MALNNLKDFSIEWILFGMLFVCLMSFGTMFMTENNPEGFGSTQGKFDAYKSNMSSALVVVEGDSNSLLNISAQNDPEVSELGSKDSVATSYGIMGGARAFLSSFKLFLTWIVPGAVGLMIASIIAGMFSLVALYFITKWIRQGA